MKNCPKCNTELRIKKTYYTVRDGVPYVVMDMTCVNRHCRNFGRIPDRIETPLPTETVPEIPEEEDDDEGQ